MLPVLPDFRTKIYVGKRKRLLFVNVKFRITFKIEVYETIIG